MRKILLFVAVVCMTHLVTAQDIAKPYKVPVNKGAAPVAKRIYYCCIECDFTAQKPARCPVHNKPLVEVGKYYCPTGDGFTSDKPGKCPKHQCDLPLMKMKFKTVTKPDSKNNFPVPHN